MGLFDRFKKQDCEICGKEVGMFGYKKLKDGEICKDCVKLLSPWFEERRESTVAQIKEQLAYRARNAEALKDFHPTKTFGASYHMFVEERSGVPYRFCVSRSEDYVKENADLVLFENVEEVIIDIEDQRCEVYEKDGENEVSYEPPRYDYSYEFRVSLLIKNTPWFDNIHFQLNRENPEIFGQEDMDGPNNVEAHAEVMEPTGDVFAVKYLRYKRMCNEIEAMVNHPGAPVREAAPAPKFCPNCGAPADGGKFCQSCGSKL